MSLSGGKKAGLNVAEPSYIAINDDEKRAESYV